MIGLLTVRCGPQRLSVRGRRHRQQHSPYRDRCVIIQTYPSTAKSIPTGRICGREALMQIDTMPTTLAIVVGRAVWL
jgi:hypothetical protein